MTQAFNYMVHSGGIDSEESYPYTGTVWHCDSTGKAIATTMKDWVDLRENEESDLQNAVAAVSSIFSMN